MRESIQEIKDLLKQRRSHLINNALDELESEIEETEKERDNYKEFYDKVKRKIRDSGRSVLSHSEFDELVIKYFMEKKDE